MELLGFNTRVIAYVASGWHTEEVKSLRKVAEGLAHRTNLRVGLITDSSVFTEYSKKINNCFKGDKNQIILLRWDGECTRMTLEN